MRRGGEKAGVRCTPKGFPGAKIPLVWRLLLEEPEPNNICSRSQRTDRKMTFCGTGRHFLRGRMPLRQSRGCASSRSGSLPCHERRRRCGPLGRRMRCAAAGPRREIRGDGPAKTPAWGHGGALIRGGNGHNIPSTTVPDKNRVAFHIMRQKSLLPTSSRTGESQIPRSGIFSENGNACSEKMPHRGELSSWRTLFALCGMTCQAGTFAAKPGV
jgi:hypothetical protein